MHRNRKPITAVAVLAAVALAAIAWWQHSPERSEPSGADTPPGEVPVPPPETKPSTWIGIGGGSVPELNQVSIEQDLALAREVFGPGKLLFAGGPGADGVQVLDPEPRGAPLRRRLAGIFAPRQGRDAHYRKTTLPVDAPATVQHAVGEIETILARTDVPPANAGAVLLYFAGHGEQGETPVQNLVRLWGQGALTVADLAKTLDTAPAGREVRVVMTTCFSGGFAELVFASGDAAKGPSKTTRCGLFASPWDLEASGCDPDPNRRQHHGYGIYFLNALKNKDREGRPLAASEIDLDGDGAVSLLEAHTRVRVASVSADVPTTTSERWLRFVGLVAGPTAQVRLPEEDAVIAAMAQRTGLVGREHESTALLANAQQAWEEASLDLRDARAAEDDAFRALAGDLLARWPVLDDPWHPDFEATLARHTAAIEAHLDSSEAYRRYEDAVTAVDRLDAFAAGLRAKAAPLERLARALKNKELAGRLKAAGGSDWAVYERLLACERGPP